MQGGYNYTHKQTYIYRYTEAFNQTTYILIRFKINRSGAPMRNVTKSGLFSLLKAPTECAE